MDPTPADKLGIPEEILKLRPPTTAAQAAARRKADEELEAKYPVGCHVAYLDNWSGDELERVVVASSTDWDEYQKQLAALAPDVRARVEIDQIRDPDEGFFAGAAF
jgi:hypothetical protein